MLDSIILIASLQKISLPDICLAACLCFLIPYMLSGRYEMTDYSFVIIRLPRNQPPVQIVSILATLCELFKCVRLAKASLRSGWSWYRLFAMEVRSWIYSFQRNEAEIKWPPFCENISNRIVLNKNCSMVLQISLNFALQGPINNDPALVQIMA